MQLTRDVPFSCELLKKKNSPEGLLEPILEPIIPSHWVVREVELVTHGGVAGRYQQKFQKSRESDLLEKGGLVNESKSSGRMGSGFRCSARVEVPKPCG